MWRAFFYAVGIGLVGLGVEALVLDRVELSRTAKLPSILLKLAETNRTSAPSADDVVEPANSYPFDNNGGANPFARNSRSSLGTSQYGPSRFAGSQYGAYGGPRVANGNSFPGRLASSSSNTRAPELTVGRPVSNNRTIYPQDWMPWCLIAGGSMIYLYTRSSTRSFGD